MSKKIQDSPTKWFENVIVIIKQKNRLQRLVIIGAGFVVKV